MPSFYLFRLRMTYDRQRPLFGKLPSPSEALREMLSTTQVHEKRKGTNWRVGNVTKIDRTACYFRLGKTGKHQLELFSNGNFVDQAFELATYTHVVLDYDLELCAIAHKGSLAPKPTGIANRFCAILNESVFARDAQISFEISSIPDPTEFIEYLKGAFAISRFWYTFSPPNPWDADQDFQKPLERTLVAIQAESGKAQFDGQNIDAEKVTAITRSVAATAEDAGATIVSDKDAAPERKRLRGNLVSLNFKDIREIDPGMVAKLLQVIRETYMRVRRGAD